MCVCAAYLKRQNEAELRRQFKKNYADQNLKKEPEKALDKDTFNLNCAETVKEKVHTHFEAIQKKPLIMRLHSLLQLLQLRQHCFLVFALFFCRDSWCGGCGPFLPWSLWSSK